MGDSLSTCFPCFGLEGPEPDHYPRRNEERGQEAKEDLVSIILGGGGMMLLHHAVR